jgi:hypothetical protein
MKNGMLSRVRTCAPFITKRSNAGVSCRLTRRLYWRSTQEPVHTNRAQRRPWLQLADVGWRDSVACGWSFLVRGALQPISSKPPCPKAGCVHELYRRRGPQFREWSQSFPARPYNRKSRRVAIRREFVPDMREWWPSSNRLKACTGLSSRGQSARVPAPSRWHVETPAEVNGIRRQTMQQDA